MPRGHMAITAHIVLMHMHTIPQLIVRVRMVLLTLAAEDIFASSVSLFLISSDSRSWFYGESTRYNHHSYNGFLICTYLLERS